jgi:hypothetical protein
MNSWIQTWGITLLVASISLQTTACCCGKTWEQAKKDAAKKSKKDKAEYENFAHGLAGLYKTFPDLTTMTEKKCADDVIKSRKKTDSTERLSTIELEFLHQFADKSIKEPHFKDKWAFLRTGWAQGLSRPGKSYDNANRMAKLKKYGYVGIVAGKVKKFPIAKGDGDFTSGQFQGWLAIVDLETFQITCQVPVNAMSSDSVKYKTRGLFKTNPQQAVIDDFKDNVKDAAGDAVKKISSELRTSWTMF